MLGLMGVGAVDVVFGSERKLMGTGWPYWNAASGQGSRTDTCSILAQVNIPDSHDYMG